MSISSVRNQEVQRAGALAAAGALYEQILAVEPHNVDALANAGVLCARAGRYDEAVAHYTRALTLAPGEPDVLTEVLRMFLLEAPKRMDRLRNAHAAGDIQEVHRSAHSLKGSAGNIGATAMYDICCEIDVKGRSGDTVALPPLIDALGLEFGKVESEIHRLIGA